MASGFLGHQEKYDRTPGPSFLVEDWPGCEPPGHARAHVHGLYRTDTLSAQQIQLKNKLFLPMTKGLADASRDCT
jgi:hypothetical protein